MTTSLCLGFPRMGAQRELKFALESFWAGRSRREELEQVARDLRRRHWQSMQAAGIGQIPCNDFSYYDQVLDTAVLVGAIPAVYRAIEDDLDRYFAMARGRQSEDVDVPALAMKKWFDTNYHYIVPELETGQRYALQPDKLLREWQEARELGITARPVLLGPVSFLLLARGDEQLASLDSLLDTYCQLLTLLKHKGVDWVQIDEPCLVLELSPLHQQAYRKALRRLADHPSPRLLLATYFGDPGENLELIRAIPWEGLHLDLTRSSPDLLEHLPTDRVVSLGLVDGRNIWRCDLQAARAQVELAQARLGADRVWVATSCSLLHVPVSLKFEPELDPEVRDWLAFAEEKLAEVVALTQAQGPLYTTSERIREQRRASRRLHRPEVRRRLEQVGADQLRRRSPFSERRRVQPALPSFPTTTIGSFPQTQEIRARRAAWRQGKLSDADYEQFLREQTADCIRRQEELGLDVLVHGEYERNDMVEFFGEKLDGFVFTRNGWVQSYGSRCVKPPVLFGDVQRPRPMTVDWARYAQSLSDRPVKGMLTGPVTILQWSFVRDDQPRRDTCFQLALALRDEVQDLEAAGIRMIQVDEPAVREGLPLRRCDWREYLGWAVDAFRLATSGVADATQIHTHMCYSEFEDILDDVGRLDADVLFIETSRSRMQSLEAFAHYPNAIGPGVYDIHSPRVPSRAEMAELLGKALRSVPADRLWVNPDCGLKTRGWPEVEAALQAMVGAAHELRQDLSTRVR